MGLEKPAILQFEVKNIQILATLSQEMGWSW
jgi:hypothetical protein